MDSVRLRDLDGQTTNPKDIQIAERCTSATTTREVQLLGFYLSEFEYFWDQQIPRSDCMNKKNQFVHPKTHNESVLRQETVSSHSPQSIISSVFYVKGQWFKELSWTTEEWYI